MNDLDELYPNYYKFRNQVSDMDAGEKLHEKLRITAGNRYEFRYAPFDYINTAAKVVIVGITPGEQQAKLAINAMKEGLTEGIDDLTIMRRAKYHASFGGSMRKNLVNMLDHIGLANLLDIPSCTEMFSMDSDIAHFTSILRYPTFYMANPEDPLSLVNYNGQDGPLRNPNTEDMIDKYFNQELTLLPDALYIPLGDKVSMAMRHFVGTRQLDDNQVLHGLPHPSGANAERIAYFTGNKSAADCSIKTNTNKIDEAKNKLLEKLAVDIFRSESLEPIH
jgi:hypothetical protein